MTYSFTKPDAGPSPAIDVNQIKTNFSQYGTIFSNNHTAMNISNQGDHESVILTKQNSDPGVTQNLSVLYCKDATSHAGTQPQLFAQIPQFLPNQNDWTQNINLGMQLTYNSVGLSGPIYYSFLPGGYLIYFGTDAGAASANPIADTIILTPTPTQILMVTATPNTLTSPGTPTPFGVYITITGSDRFVINSVGNGANPIPYSFGWVAIAKA